MSPKVDNKIAAAVPASLDSLRTPQLSSELFSETQAALAQPPFTQNFDLRLDASATNGQKTEGEGSLNIEQVRSTLLTQLASARAAGFRLVATNTLSIDSETSMLSMYLSHALINFEDSPCRVTTDLPTNNYIWRYGSQVEIAPEFRTDSAVQVVPFIVRLSESSSGGGEARLYNTLDPQTPLILQANFELEEGGKRPRDEVGLAKLIVERAISALPTVQLELDQIAPDANYSLVVHRSANHKLSQSDFDALRKVEEQGFTISVNYHPERGEIDRFEQFGNLPLGKEYSFDLNSNDLSNLGYSAIEVKGDVSEIILSREHLVSQQEHIEPVTFSTKDVYGNSISLKRGLVGSSGEDYIIYENIIISPPLPFATNANESLPIKFDLSVLGEKDLGKFSTFLYRKGLAPSAVQDELNIYSNLHSPEFSQLWQQCQGAVVNDLNAVESYFGHSPRELIQNVYVANARSANAYFSLVNPETVVIQDEYIRDNPKCQNLGFHEGIHLIDGASQWELSGGALAEVWENLKSTNSSFLHKINEKNLIPGVLSGGHSQDNSKELLASLCNSIYFSGQDPQAWSEKIHSYSVEERSAYLQCLEALENNLGIQSDKAGAVKVGAPIFNEIGRAIAALKANLSDR